MCVIVYTSRHHRMLVVGVVVGVGVDVVVRVGVGAVVVSRHWTEAFTNINI